jgi:hypothetical protein
MFSLLEIFVKHICSFHKLCHDQECYFFKAAYILIIRLWMHLKQRQMRPRI